MKMKEKLFIKENWSKSEERRVCPYVISNGIRLNVVLSALNVDYLYEYAWCCLNTRRVIFISKIEINFLYDLLITKRILKISIQYFFILKLIVFKWILISTGLKQVQISDVSRLLSFISKQILIKIVHYFFNLRHKVSSFHSIQLMEQH